MTTAWDGYSRVDYVPEAGRLVVTMTTAEPTTYRRLRPGLAATFVTDDPDGPPTSLVVDLDVDLGGDLLWLLGSRLAPVARAVIAGESRGVGVRLEADEVAELAERWAPYRAEVLAGAVDAPVESVGSRVGRWAHGLWVRLGGQELVDAVAAVAIPSPLGHFRGAELDDWPTVELPSELAAAAGVTPVVYWRTNSGQRARVRLRVRRADQDRAPEFELVAGFDDGSSGWELFLPTRFDPAMLEAVLPVEPGHELTRIRLGTRRIGDA